MPFTPYHFGPGALFKAFLLRRFSFAIFMVTQIIIDLEPAYYLFRDDPPLHRFLHTYVGATWVALFVIIFGRPLCHWLLRAWNRVLQVQAGDWGYATPEISTIPAAVGALLGAYSHVALDSILYGEMQPFKPFLLENHLLDLATLDQLHFLCFLAGVAGILLLFLVHLFQRVMARLQYFRRR